MVKFSKMRKSVIDGSLELKSLEEKKPLFRSAIGDLSIFSTDLGELEALIRLCLDYYAYSDGDVLISDTEYDEIMKYWANELKLPVIVYPDTITGYRTWPFVEHRLPGMVGTVKKEYDEDLLLEFFKKNSGCEKYVIAPKFDGISVCIEVENGLIKCGLTRADGSKGQDITPVIKGAKNSSTFMDSIPGGKDGFYKCELVMAQDDFRNLVVEKQYANRRSATSGIVNAPKNLIYAKYITIIPLLYVKPNIKALSHDVFTYFPHDMITMPGDTKPKELRRQIFKLLEKIRDVSYDYRVDGVVIFPMGKNMPINEADYMDTALAFKINTAEAPTIIDFGYVSVGRMGYAIPMLKVLPVEVNETIVTDVSLGSFDKFGGLALHEGETVIVFSAGDVIPQIKMPRNRKYADDAEYLVIEKVCPYCEIKLDRIGAEYRCTNRECVRVVTGRISKFLQSLGAENFGDATVESLYHAKLLRSIRDLFSIEEDEITLLPGFDVISSRNIIGEIKKIKTKGVTISELFGALGITDLGERKCRKIFEVADIDFVMSKSSSKITHRLMNADGIGMKSAMTFCDFITDNRALIEFLLKTIEITQPKTFRGNVVFTGFRDEGLKTEFEKLGYEVAAGINKNTLAVISGSYEHSSKTCKSANKKGIGIYDLVEVPSVLLALAKRNQRLDNPPDELTEDDFDFNY